MVIINHKLIERNKVDMRKEQIISGVLNGNVNVAILSNTKYGPMHSAFIMEENKPPLKIQMRSATAALYVLQGMGKVDFECRIVEIGDKKFNAKVYTLQYN